MANTLKVPDALTEVMQIGTFAKGLDITYDELRLMGSLIGLVTLLQVATYSQDEKARTSAAKSLIDLKEDPADIVERLKSAPFGNLSIKSLEYVVKELSDGRTDLEEIYAEATERQEDTETVRERTSA